MDGLNTDFDDIRPYNDSEVNAVLTELCNEPMFAQALHFVFPERNIESIKHQLLGIKSVKQFQQEIVSAAVNSIARTSTQGIRLDGLENTDKDSPYLILSNHRDIVLDSAFLNFLLFTHDIETTRIAIGDNLLQKKWIEQLVRLNKNFIVKRNLSPRELVAASDYLSSFIRKSIVNDRSSVWIAQREGRTKDGNDRTASGLIKMFLRSKKPDQSAYDAAYELNIIPLSISYEWEPCDILKVKENLIRQSGQVYIKRPGEDLESMLYGIRQPKGRVILKFGKPFNHYLERVDKNINSNELSSLISQYIDRSIFENYHLYPGNYLAYDLKNQSRKFVEQYSEDDKDHFEAYVNALANGDEKIKTGLIELYANPVYNSILA